MRLEGKRIAVVGGAGFIGSHTVDRLLTEDVAEVIVYDNFSGGSPANLATAVRDPRVRIYEAGGDICHSDVLHAAIRNIDCVFHFAALWLLQCEEFPRSAFEVNVEGTYNVFDACVANGVQRLVFSSSASVYGNAVEEPMTEDHPLNNLGFYGATKISGEAMARALHHRYGLPYVALRYMNVYGPRQRDDGAYGGVVSKMLAAIDRGTGPEIHGDGNQALDFIHVEDCAAANIYAAKSDFIDRAYNVATGIKTTINELALKLLALADSTASIHYLEPRSLGAIRNRIGSTTRAEQEIGFMAAVGLDEGLRTTIATRVQSISRAQNSERYPDDALDEEIAT